MTSKEKLAALVVGGKLKPGDRVAIDSFRFVRRGRWGKYRRCWNIYKVCARKRDGQLQFRSDGYKLQPCTRPDVAGSCEFIVDGPASGGGVRNMHNVAFADLIQELLPCVITRAL